MAEAKAYMDNYFARYQGVKRYMKQLFKAPGRKGYVETLYHRRRSMPELKSSILTCAPLASRWR